MGAANNLWKCLEKKFPDMENLAKKLHIVKSGYHGKTYEGNEIKKILANIPKMRAMVPRKYQPFVKTFEALRKISTDI